ncbi:hypothetical protein ON010_g13964 [Phytophthora cinnamomi]|nr:hypothetical protein ON010_g13964 [Phytophthora cinnamomi]
MSARSLVSRLIPPLAAHWHKGQQGAPPARGRSGRLVRVHRGAVLRRRVESQDGSRPVPPLLRGGGRGPHQELQPRAHRAPAAALGCVAREARRVGARCRLGGSGREDRAGPAEAGHARHWAWARERRRCAGDHASDHCEGQGRQLAAGSGRRRAVPGESGTRDGKGLQERHPHAQRAAKIPPAQLSEALGFPVVVQKGSVDTFSDGKISTATVIRGDSFTSNVDFTGNPLLLAAYGGSLVTRASSSLAFDEHQRSMTAPDVLHSVGKGFVKAFPNASM